MKNATQKRKVFVAVMAGILAILLLASAFAVAFSVGAASSTSAVYTLVANDVDGKHYVDTEGKTDVLSQITGYYNAPTKGKDYQESTHLPKLTDSVYAIEPFKDLYGVSYFNLSWCTSGEQDTRESAGGTIAYNMYDGSINKYFYSFEWKDLDVDVDSFALYMNNETSYVDYYTNESYAWYQADSAFDILVSTDGGVTYTVAYESKRYKTNGSNFTEISSWLKADGGDWEMYDAVDNDGNSLFRYRKLSADFNQEYKCVTNIVYACVAPRRNGKVLTAFYYAARLSEIDVYGTINSTKYDQTEPEREEQPVIPVAEEESSSSVVVPHEDGVSIKVEQDKTAAEDGLIHLNATITNNNSYTVFGKKVSSVLSEAGFEQDAADVSAISRIEPGQSATVALTYKKVEAVVETTAEEETTETPASSDTEATESKGCGSSVGAVAVIAVCVSALVLLILGKGNIRKTGIFMLAFICCLTVAGIPALAAEDNLPTVTVTKALVEGTDATHRELVFVADTNLSNYEVSAETEVVVDGVTYKITVTAMYSEAEITAAGMRSTIVDGAITDPIAIQKGKSLNLKNILGTDIAVTISGDSFSAAYPDEIYTQDYNISFETIAYIEYNLRGETGKVWSDVFSTSVKKAANAQIKDSETAEDVKTMLQTEVVKKAGTTSTITSEEEAELRQAILAKMKEMASVEWVMTNDISTNGQINYETPDYQKGKTYVGLIYNQHCYGTVENFSYLLDANGNLKSEWTDSVDTLWKYTPGASCSTCITGSYAYFINGLKNLVSATNMSPSKSGYGFSALGDYKVPSGELETGNIISANDEQTMCKAYAQMQTADMLVANWYNSSNSLLGHVVMVTEAPNVVYNSDGTIDPDKSTVKTIEQNATVSEVGTTGKLTTWPEKTLTFRTLMTGKILKYVPVKYTNLSTDSTEPLYFMLSDLNKGSLLTYGLYGTIESNYPVRYVGVTITDETGKTVYDYKYSPASGYAKSVRLSSMTEVKTAISSLPTGTYTVKITALAKNAEKVFYEGTETK